MAFGVVEVCSQPHGRAAIPPGKQLPIPIAKEAGWAHRAGLDVVVFENKDDHKAFVSDHSEPELCIFVSCSAVKYCIDYYFGND
jgi:hypothetical protein